MSQVYSGGCPCDFDFVGGGVPIAGTFAASFQGTWNGFIDYTAPSGSTTVGIVHDQFYLVKTPLVAVLHGFLSDCGGVATLMANLTVELAIASDRVQCYKYDYEDGVTASAQGVGEWLRDFNEDVDPSQSEIDIVAHSMGGLVARHYFELGYNGALDPAVGSISMAGTPNEGVNIAKLERFICPRWARVVPIIDRVCILDDINSLIGPFDLHSQAIDDFKPGSDVLDALNDSFVLPSSPYYRAHIGVRNTWLGRLLSGRSENDCFISHDSTFGPSDVFGALSPRPRRECGGVSHSGTIPSCNGSNTLTNNLAVAQGMLADIKPLFGFPAPPAGLASAAPLAAENTLPGESAYLELAEGGVTDGGGATHEVVIPPGLPSVTFAAMWAGGENPSQLTVDLVRPSGAGVQPSDPDVLEEITLDGSASAFYVAGSGLAIANPVAGVWSVQVTGVSTGTDGAPYMVSVAPESAVSLSGGTDTDVVLAGGEQSVVAELQDAGSPVTATITARILKVDGTEQVIQLLDDGTSGDVAAGDKRYSRSVPTAGACGTVRLLLEADATGTSEGSVHREQLASFDVNVPGDATRDPCNPDDDDDGLTDEAELDVHGTNPVNPDSDGDNLDDPDELLLGTDPQDPDTENDGFNDAPAVAHTGPANTSALSDNCPALGNPTQANADGNFIDLPPTKAFDDLTWVNSDPFGNACDSDDDNDGLLDSTEAGPPCASATAATNPLLADTDGDRVLDGAECLLGSDPASASSVPAAIVQPDADNDGVPDQFDPNDASADSDGDGVLDRVEFRHYNSNLSAVNSDGDVCGDAREIASINADIAVNVIDLQQIAGAAGPFTSPAYIVNYDVNKSGAIDVIDLQFVSGRNGPCP